MAQKKKDSLKLLKFIVHFMGVILLLGIILLFVLVFQRYKEKISQETSVLPDSDECSAQEFILPETGEVKSVTYEDDSITVVLEDDLEGLRAQKILVIDLCNHAVKHKVVVKQ